MKLYWEHIESILGRLTIFPIGMIGVTVTRRGKSR